MKTKAMLRRLDEALALLEAHPPEDPSTGRCAHRDTAAWAQHRAVSTCVRVVRAMVQDLDDRRGGR